jgi:hypothetical protein
VPTGPLPARGTPRASSARTPSGIWVLALKYFLRTGANFEAVHLQLAEHSELHLDLCEGSNWSQSLGKAFVRHAESTARQSPRRTPHDRGAHCPQAAPPRVHILDELLPSVARRQQHPSLVTAHRMNQAATRATRLVTGQDLASFRESQQSSLAHSVEVTERARIRNRPWEVLRAAAVRSRKVRTKTYSRAYRSEHRAQRVMTRNGPLSPSP